MTNNDLTYITGILDRSGSMASIRAQAEDGWNAFVAEQAAQPGQCEISLVQFDDVIEVVYDHIPAREITPFSLDPRNSTALLDAIGMTITALGSKLAAMSEDARPGSVIIVVVTDGHENASREFTLQQVNTMTRHQSDGYGWQFVFLGANLDAVAAGQDLGIGADRSMTYRPDAVGSAMGLNSAKITGYRTAKRAGVAEAVAGMALDWNEDERRDLGEAG